MIFQKKTSPAPTHSSTIKFNTFTRIFTKGVLLRHHYPVSEGVKLENFFSREMVQLHEISGITINKDHPGGSSIQQKRFVDSRLFTRWHHENFQSIHVFSLT